MPVQKGSELDLFLAGEVWEVDKGWNSYNGWSGTKRWVMSYSPAMWVWYKQTMEAGWAAAGGVLLCLQCTCLTQIMTHTGKWREYQQGLMEEKLFDVKIKILIKENMQDSNPQCFQMPVFPLQKAATIPCRDGGTCRDTHSSPFLSPMQLNNEVIWVTAEAAIWNVKETERPEQQQQLSWISWYVMWWWWGGVVGGDYKDLFLGAPAALAWLWYHNTKCHKENAVS